MIKGKSGNNEFDFNYGTVVPQGSGRNGLDVLPKAIYPVSLIPSVAEAVIADFKTSIRSLEKKVVDPTLNIIKLTGHAIRVGDVIRMRTLGINDAMELPVVEVLDVDHVLLGSSLAQDPVGEDFLIMRHVTLTIDKDGNLSTSSGPLQFQLDGAAQTVTEDTAVPANNEALPTKLFVDIDGVETQVAEDTAVPANTIPMPMKSMYSLDGDQVSTLVDTAVPANTRGFPIEMYFEKDGVKTPVIRDTAIPANNAAVPVEIIGVGGTTINITAGDINVQLSHLGATFDSTRIGDGTNLLGINANLEALVHDADAHALIRMGIIDTIPLLDIGATNIPASVAVDGLELVAATSAIIRKVQTIEDIGEFLGLYSGLSGALVLEAILPLAGGEVDVNIPAATRLSIKNLKNAVINGNVFMTGNLLG